MDQWNKITVLQRQQQRRKVCSRAQAEYEELNHIDKWNEITANDNSNEEKSTIKVILVAARNVMKPLSGLQLLLH